MGDLNLAILLGNGDGTFAVPAYYYDGVSTTDVGAAPLLAADFNNDGKVDIAVNSFSKGTNTFSAGILYGNGDGTFQPLVSPATLSNFPAYFTADINNDGNADLVGSQIALGNGGGAFTVLPESYSSPIGSAVAGLADFNGDGKLDLFTAVTNNFPTSPTGVYLGNGDGTFGPFIPVPTHGFLLPSLFADMNGDGQTDIVFLWDKTWGVQRSVSGIGVLLNTTPPVPDFVLASTTATSQTVSAGQSAPFSLQVTPSGSFTGIVNLSCAITPAVTPAPTCSLSRSSIQIVDSSSQSITVTVGTTAPATSAMAPITGFPRGALPLAWTPIMFGSGWLLLSGRKRRPSLAVYLMVVGLTYCIACGGNSSSTHRVTQGTPSGKYSVTVTSVAGTLNHNVGLQVVVQ